MSWAAEAHARSAARGKPAAEIDKLIAEAERLVERDNRRAENRIEFDDVRARHWARTYLATLRDERAKLGGAS